MSAASAAALALAFSIWASFNCSCSIIAWLSLSLACIFSLGNSINLVLLLPHIGITKGLVQLPGEVVLGTDLLIVVLLQAISHVLHVPELSKKADSLLCLVVGNGFLFIKGRHQGRLGLGHQAGVGVELLQLAEKVGILNGDPSLAGLKVAQVEVHLLNLLGQLIQGSGKGPLGLFGGSLRSGHLVCCCTNIANFICNLAAVLGNLGFHLVQLVHLLRHFGDGIGLLLLQAHQGGVMLNVALLQILPELADFTLPLLVQLNLSSCGSAGLVKPLAETFHLPRQV